MNPRRLEAVSPCAVINATSVGMSAAPATPEWDAAMRFVSRVPFEQWPTGLAFDLVYTPARTAFLAHAEAGGWRTLGGLDMLARQGALSFERWTGVAADDVLPAMRRALADAI